MKFRSILLTAAVGVMLSSCGESDAVEATDEVEVETPEVVSATYTVDVDASTMNWEGSKLAYSHSGDIKISEGSLSTEGESIVGGNFTINMRTMMETGNPDTAKVVMLIGHLMSPDFFNVDSFPTAEFVITEAMASEAGDGTQNISGNLTIMGVAKNISFPATVAMDGDGLTATATFTINRTDWGVKYGSGSFFEDLGDDAIGDDIKFDVNLTANK